MSQPAPASFDGVQAVTDASYRQFVTGSRLPVLLALTGRPLSSTFALDPILEEVARMRAGTLVVGRLDIAANPRTADAWGVTTGPVLLVLAAGRLQRVLLGVRPAQRLLEELNEALAGTAHEEPA